MVAFNTLKMNLLSDDINVQSAEHWGRTGPWETTRAVRLKDEDPVKDKDEQNKWLLSNSNTLDKNKA